MGRKLRAGKLDHLDCLSHKQQVCGDVNRPQNTAVPAGRIGSAAVSCRRRCAAEGPAGRVAAQGRGRGLSARGQAAWQVPAGGGKGLACADMGGWYAVGCMSREVGLGRGWIPGVGR